MMGDHVGLPSQEPLEVTRAWLDPSAFMTQIPSLDQAISGLAGGVARGLAAADSSDPASSGPVGVSVQARRSKPATAANPHLLPIVCSGEEGERVRLYAYMKRPASAELRPRLSRATPVSTGLTFRGKRYALPFASESGCWFGREWRVRAELQVGKNFFAAVSPKRRTLRSPRSAKRIHVVVRDANETGAVGVDRIELVVVAGSRAGEERLGAVGGTSSGT